MDNLEFDLKELVISTLHLEEMSVNDIKTDQPLFGDGLGLDSIDALELGVAIKKKYEISLNLYHMLPNNHWTNLYKPHHNV